MMNEYTKELAYLRLAAFQALGGWGTENMDPEEKKWRPVIPWTLEKRQEKADEFVKWMLRSGEMDSTSDERVVNNVMRHEYRVLTEEEKKQQMLLTKDLGKAFYDRCTAMGNSRELSLAKTKIEEAVMWAVKHVTE